MKLPKPGEGGDYTPAPAGTFMGVCFRFVDLGTQKVEFQGQIKFQRKVVISWELCDELMDDGKPFIVSKRYTWSMSDKANLRHDLEGWRGKAFSPEDFGENGFNTKKLIGQPCTLTITHTQKPDGKVYANVASVGKIMKGLQPAPLRNETVYIALEQGDFNPAIYEKLSDGLKSLIAASPEYKELTGQKPAAAQHEPVGLGGQIDDEIPF